MKRYALVGYPLGHSLSPVIHKALFQLSGADADYTLLEVSPECLPGMIAQLKELDGFNVTIPHKVAIIAHLDRLEGKAKLFGAVNTVQCGEQAVGYNTDCIGFRQALDLAGIALSGRVLLCGCGGVSRMLAYESVLESCDLTIAVREADVKTAKQLKSELEAEYNCLVHICLLDDVSGSYDLLINGTPVGMHPNVNAMPVRPDTVDRCAAVFDTVYNPKETLLLQHAARLGLKCAGGMAMLVSQAAAAQAYWNGVSFTKEQIESVIHQARTALEGIS